MSSAVDEGEGLSGARLRWAVLAVSFAVLISVMDSVMLNVALPTVAIDLNISPAESIWAVNAYQLAVVISLLPLGKFADMFGARRVYLWCIGIFGVGSIGCALSDSLLSLSMMRFVQGCGGAGMMGVTNSMLRHIYPSHKLGRGIGLNGLIAALAIASGPSVASLLLTALSWQWIFLINIPIVLVLIVFGRLAFPVSKSAGGRVHLHSIVLSMAGFGILIFGINGIAHGQDWRLVLVFLVLGVGLCFLLIRAQLCEAAPLLPVDLLSIPRYRFAVGAIFGASCAQLMAYVSIPFFFLNNLGLTQIETGLLFIPWPIAIAMVAPLSGLLSSHYPPKLLAAGGLAIFAGGLASLALASEGAGFSDIIWRMALCGAGYGLFQPPNSRALVSSVPLARTGSANALGATGRVLGQSIGAAIVAMLFYALPAQGTEAALLGASLVAMMSSLAGVFSGIILPWSGRKSSSID